MSWRPSAASTWPTTLDVKVRASSGGEVFFEVNLADAWVWDIYRSTRFVRSVRIVTFKDVNVEELNKADFTRELDLRD